MTHGVHAVQHEVEHEIEHGGGASGHNLLDSINKKVALLIGVMALFLALSETLGKSAQTGAISYNIEAANLWGFFQAKNIRRTVALYHSEPEVQEGTVELAERAKVAEKKRDTALARYHQFEMASAAIQIGIVLASATIITGMIVLTWIAIGLGGIGVLFMAIGLFAPHAVHMF